MYNFLSSLNFCNLYFNIDIGNLRFLNIVYKFYFINFFNKSLVLPKILV